MSDPRTYQRNGACFSWEVMDRQDNEEEIVYGPAAWEQEEMGVALDTRDHEADSLEQEVADRERDEWEGLSEAY